MSASSRGRRALQAAVSSTSPGLCVRCAFSSSSSLRLAPRIPARLYSSAAETTPDASSSSSIPSSSSVSGSAAPSPSTAPAPGPYDLCSGMILTRPPLLTRRLHPFENAFFFYQKRLEERLNTPFITDIFFKPDTARRLDWNVKVKDRRGTVAKELGVYNGKSSRAWDDELRIGDSLSDEKSIVSALLKDAEVRVSDDAELIPAENVVPVEPPADRLTEADRTGDVRRLDRQLDRTLYLVVKGKEGWQFPSGIIAKHENLHESAQRVLDQSAGVNMNTWIVGRVPVAHVIRHPRLNDDGTVEKKGHKTFLLKGRIMAGQANIEGNPFGFSDFKWLTREELRKDLRHTYYQDVRNMMADR